MAIEDLNLEIEKLGRCSVSSPMTKGQFVNDEDRVLYHCTLKEAETCIDTCKSLPSFEMAGPREKIYFDPSKLKCGIVTCGGICPGLNDVIRAIVLSLHYHYQVNTVFGFRYGYEGISPRHRHVPLELNPKIVEDIHEKGGTILGSSRGPQDVSEMADTLERMNIRLLFAIGGDGTLRGAQAISEEIGRRSLKIGVVGIPKTIDNDISFVEQSFGFETAVSAARPCISAAHVEAKGARNGVGLVKLMGRESGFIAAYATLASSDVNFCLVPEVPFTLERFLPVLKEKIKLSDHSVIVVAEGCWGTMRCMRAWPAEPIWWWGTGTRSTPTCRSPWRFQSEKESIPMAVFGAASWNPPGNPGIWRVLPERVKMCAQASHKRHETR